MLVLQWIFIKCLENKFCWNYGKCFEKHEGASVRANFLRGKYIDHVEKKAQNNDFHWGKPCQTKSALFKYEEILDIYGYLVRCAEFGHVAYPLKKHCCLRTGVFFWRFISVKAKRWGMHYNHKYPSATQRFPSHSSIHPTHASNPLIALVQS